MNTVRVWLLRHGETDSNRVGEFQGHLDVELNGEGFAQANATAMALAGVEFRKIYSSDLLRAAQTAAAIASGRELRIAFDRDLRETHYGILQGAPYGEAATRLAPHGLGNAWESGEFEARGLSAPGGESCRQVLNRAKRFLRRLDVECGDGAIDEVLIVAHGGLLRIMLAQMLQLPLSTRRRFAFGNCGLSRIAVSPRTSMLEFHNVNFWDTGVVDPGHNI